jgi:hypothetical protein
MSSHYRGGNILFTYVGDPSLMFYLLTQHGLSDTAFITDANGPQFANALQHPEQSVTWIVMNAADAAPEDRLWKALHARMDWRRHFVLRRRFIAHLMTGHGYGTTEIYERRPRPPGTHPVGFIDRRGAPRASTTCARRKVLLNDLGSCDHPGGVGWLLERASTGVA